LNTNVIAFLIILYIKNQQNKAGKFKVKSLKDEGFAYGLPVFL